VKRRTAELLDAEPPHNSEVERQLLGSMVLDPDRLEAVAPLVSTADFYHDAHRRLYNHLLAMRNGGGGAIDETLLLERLKEAGELEAVGGTAYLAQVLRSVAVAAHAEYYAGIVKKYAGRRRAIQAALEILQDAYDEKASGTGLVERVQRLLDETAPSAIGSPDLLNLSSVTPTTIDWLWPNRIPVGKVSLLAGDPGLGKSLITVDIAARVTTGRFWPELTDQAQRGGVVLLSAEDDTADTIVPRLHAADADLSRIHLLTAIEWYDSDRNKKTQRSFSLERDLPALATAIDKTPGCRLVVIDPISSYLGKTDSHKNADVRAVLAPLAELAQQKQVAVLAVSHLTKAGGPAVGRVMGSLAFVAAARAVWCVACDKEDKSLRLLLPVKCNLGPRPTGLSYKVLNPEGQPYLAWSPEPVEVDTDEALAADSEYGAERRDAKEWLREALADGPLLSKDLERMAKESGHNWRTVKRAKAELGVIAQREGFGRDGTWHWKLP